MVRARVFAVRLTILFGVVLGTVMGSRPSALAESREPSVFFGFVVPLASDALPVRVRAVGADGTVCGTSDVAMSGDGLGFYLVNVASELQRSGCFADGDEVQFVLLHGPIDEGVRAITFAETSYVSGRAIRADLIEGDGRLPFVLGGWSGPLPPSGGVALLTWAGPENTPVEQAVQTLGIEVVGVWQLPPGTQRFVSYIPGAPAFAQTYRTVHTGEIVFVRAR